MYADTKIYLEIARDLIVAKLERSAPGHTSKEAGEEIAEMYEVIYNKVKTLATQTENSVSI